MGIPRRFKLLGITYTVSLVAPTDWHSTEAVGLFDSTRNHIAVLAGNPDANAQAFWHECVHAILKAMGKSKLYEDEAFVDLFASMIHQIIVTSED